ncbi:MAG: hypothetical protein M5U28_38985 [Sandaracinaceae bacterium]|nr:hypothetical protein [Sandaracinaceae bacterium]
MKAEVLRAAKVVTTIIGAGVLAIALLAAAVFAYSFLRGEARIGVTCSVGGLLSRNSCQFTNTGSGAGSSCVVVTLRNRASGASIESQPTCSGEVPAGDSTERAVMFIDRTRPFQLCPGDMERSCDMEIVMLDEAGRPRRTSRPASPPPNAAEPEQEPRIVSTAAGEVLTDCGRLVAGYDSAGNRRPESWSRWACTDEESAGERWAQCLPRGAYTWNTGCPREQRCCPPPEAAP